jgi:hypothetical protein
VVAAAVANVYHSMAHDRKVVSSQFLDMLQVSRVELFAVP